MKPETWTWLMLVGLTTLGFWIRPTSAGTWAVPVVLLLATVKGWLVLERFMELRRAHWVWRLGMPLGFLLIALGLLASG